MVGPENEAAVIFRSLEIGRGGRSFGLRIWRDEPEESFLMGFGMIASGGANWRLASFLAQTMTSSEIASLPRLVNGSGINLQPSGERQRRYLEIGHILTGSSAA